MFSAVRNEPAAQVFFRAFRLFRGRKKPSMIAVRDLIKNLVVISILGPRVAHAQGYQPVHTPLLIFNYPLSYGPLK